MDKTEFSFDWIIEDSDNRITELLALHRFKQWDVAFVKAKIRISDNEFVTRYEAGNPLLEGIKHFKTFSRAQKYYNQLVDRLIQSGAR